jgi:exosortase
VRGQDISAEAQICSASTLEWFGSKRRQMWIAAVLGSLALLYAPILKALAEQWWTNPDYSHGFLVPLFSFWVLWQDRQRLARIRPAPLNSGLLVMVGALLLLFLGSLGAELFVARISLLVFLAGISLFLFGWPMLCAIAFPLAYLSCAIPFPVLVYNQITFPLQILASRLASQGLEWVHVPVFRDGNILVLSNYSLEVVEACSGIRSLMSLAALTLAYSYLAERRLWVRYLLILLTIPGAIISNALRIVGAGVLAHRFGPEAAEGFLHAISGWATFLTAFGVLLLGHRLAGAIPKTRELHPV